MTDILISYPRSQQQFALRLDDALRRAGYSTWTYARNSDPLQNREMQINEAVKNAKLQIVVVTRQVLDLSGGVRFEYEAMAAQGKPIIPAMLFPTDLPKALKNIPPIDFSGDFVAAFDQLAEVISAEIAKLAAAPAEVKNVLITYHHTGRLGSITAQKETELFLSDKGYSVKSVNFAAINFDDDLKREISKSDYIILILSKESFRALIVGANSFNYAIKYLLEITSQILIISISPDLVFDKAPIISAGFGELANYPLVKMPFSTSVPSKTLDELLSHMQPQRNILIIYRDLVTSHSIMGPTNAAKTISEYLTSLSVPNSTFGFTDTPKDDNLSQLLDTTTDVIAIVSNTSLSFFSRNEDRFKLALEGVIRDGKNLITFSISRGTVLGNPTITSSEELKQIKSLMYLTPVYMPPEVSGSYLKPLVELLNIQKTRRFPVKPHSVAKPHPTFLPLKENLSHHIFLSYKRMDGETMRRVRDDLRRHGFIVWTDELIEKGTPQWQREIERAIRGTATLVCLLSPEAAQSDYVREELAAAKMFKKPVFMALIRGTREECFIYGFVNTQSTDLRTPETYTNEFPLLAQAIKRRL